MTRDAVIIGAGPNSLVAGALLSRSGWSVLLLDSGDRPGGGLRTEELILPGFRHDVYAGFLILFAISQAYAELGPELGARGLAMANTDTPLGVILPDGRATVLTTDMQRNVAEAERLHRGDGAGWQDLVQSLGARAGQIFPLLSSELTSPAAQGMMRQLFVAQDGGPSPYVGEFLDTARNYLQRQFGSDEWRALLAPWVYHSGRGPEDANTAYSVQLCGLGVQMAGLPVGVGGAEAMATSLVKLIEDHGGRLECGVVVERILVEGGRAVGVRTSAGQEHRAGRAVLACANPDQLYLKLLEGSGAVTPEFRTAARRYRYGHSVMVVHLALGEPPHWVDERLDACVYTHVCDGIDGVSRNYNETTRRLLPAQPVVGVGVPTVTDPSRAPAGKAVMVLQALDTPFDLKGDAAGRIDVGDGTWSEAVKNAYADRVVQTVAAHIPNLERSILGRCVQSPLDLRNANMNWNHGDPYSGAHDLAQSFLMRPLPVQPSHRTPVEGLWQIGASTFPGLGLGGVSGYMVAKQLLACADST
ncbi:MAG: NAD(P)/FAD-dependent oxidoreductase [Candidatus Latescibacterota bacterium]